MLRCFEIIHEGNNNRARKKEAGSSNYAPMSRYRMHREASISMLISLLPNVGI